jgi:hypothetical protein
MGNTSNQDDSVTSTELAAEAKDKVNSEPVAVSNSKKQSKQRHRASVACTSCRDRRIRVCLTNCSSSATRY